MRKIKITEDQNFSIHIEKEIDENNFFFHEYETAVECLNHIWADQAATNPKHIQDDLLIENPNNIIAFCGERGSGKSSVMLSFVNALHYSGEGDSRFVFSDPVRHNNWDSKIIIDPSIFDGVHNIVDIVLAHIFQSFNDAYQKDNQKFDKYEREHLYKLMSKVYKNLSIIKNKEKMLDDEYDEAGNIGKLQKLGESIQLRKTLKELISVYLEMISKVTCKQGEKCEKLLIAIDDLDLCNEYAYETAEQIRKYLILPNVIIFMAIKIDQLKLGIEEKNRKDFKNIIEGYSGTDTIDYELSDMSEKYLTKLIPMTRRIFLPDLSSRAFSLELSDGMNLNDLNAEETILNLIREKTGMIMGATTEDTYHYLVPENLREFVNFVAFLGGLEDTGNLQNIYLKNLNDFKIYFINDILKTTVRKERFRNLKEVLDCARNTKNYNMRVYLNKLLFDNSNSTAFVGSLYEYPLASFAAVVDGLYNVMSYLTKKEDYQLIYYLKVYYTVILNQEFLENRFPYELTGGFIWGNKINAIIPSSLLNNGQYFSRGRFILDIRECWKIICKEIPLTKMSLEDKIVDLFSLSNNNQLYVKGIAEDDKWRTSSAWILMATLVSGTSSGHDGKNYVYDTGFIYDNHSVAYVNVSPSIENYFGALCTIERTVEKASLQKLGLSQEDVEKIVQRLISENKEQIKIAQKIAVNPELSMQLMEYCQMKSDYRNSEKESRTYQLYKKFFRNVQSFLQEQKLETVDMSMLWIPIEEVHTGEKQLNGVKIDICKIYAEMYEKQKSILNALPDNSNILEAQKLKLNFSTKVSNISRIKYIGKIRAVPGSLRNRTVERVKEKLEDIANYIQDYTYKNQKFPDGFEKDVLIKIYSEIVDLYIQDPKNKISEEQHKTYQRIAQVVNQSDLK